MNSKITVGFNFSTDFYTYLFELIKDWKQTPTSSMSPKSTQLDTTQLKLTKLNSGWLNFNPLN